MVCFSLQGQSEKSSNAWQTPVMIPSPAHWHMVLCPAHRRVLRSCTTFHKGLLASRKFVVILRCDKFGIDPFGEVTHDGGLNVALYITH